MHFDCYYYYYVQLFSWRQRTEVSSLELQACSHSAGSGGDTELQTFNGSSSSLGLPFWLLIDADKGAEVKTGVYCQRNILSGLCNLRSAQCVWNRMQKNWHWNWFTYLMALMQRFQRCSTWSWLQLNELFFLCHVYCHCNLSSIKILS